MVRKKKELYIELLSQVSTHYVSREMCVHCVRRGRSGTTFCYVHSSIELTCYA